MQRHWTQLQLVCDVRRKWRHIGIAHAARVFHILQCVSTLVLVSAGCSPEENNTSDVRVDMTLEPSPPTVGEAEVSLDLADADGAAIEGAQVKVEGNMNHAGMQPSFADLTEVEPGRYAGKLDFTMGGDWFLLVNAKTSDGRTVERKIDVPGVKSD